MARTKQTAAMPKKRKSVTFQEMAPEDSDEKVLNDPDEEEIIAKRQKQNPEEPNQKKLDKKQKAERKKQKKVAAEAAAAKAAAAEAAAAEAAAAEAAAAKAAAAEATGTEAEKKEKKKYMRLMVDWRPDIPPEKIYDMTLGEMKAELEAQSDGELIDSDEENEKYEYKGKMHTGASIITKFSAEAVKAHERFDAHVKAHEGKEQGAGVGDKAANSVPRARGAKTKVDQWERFQHTERTRMSANTYKKYTDYARRSQRFRAP